MAPANWSGEQCSRRLGTGQWLNAARRLGCRYQLLLIFLILPLVFACSSDRTTDSSPIPAVEPGSVVVTKEVTASVLITSRPPEPSPEVQTIQVSPGSIVLNLGEVSQLSAQAYGADGRELTEVEFVWGMVDPRAGAIDNEGEFRAGITPGVFRDAVSVTGVQNTPAGIRFARSMVSVTIIGESTTREIASIVILPGNPKLLTRQIFRFRAIGFDEHGEIIPAVTFTWQVNDPSLGRINEIGYLTTESPAQTYRGGLTVTGIWGGTRVSASTDVTVVKTPEQDDFLLLTVLPRNFRMNPGERLQLRAVALNGLGELVTGTELRWRMADAEAGTIDGGGAFIAGDTPGVYTEAIRVDAFVPGEEGFTRAADFASVVIRTEDPLRRLEAVRVVPNLVTADRSERAFLVAQAIDRFGNPIQDFEVNWQIADEEVGQIDEHGSFTAGRAPGVYPESLRVTVVQQLGEEVITRTESVDVIITGNLTELQIHPELATIAPDRTVHFSVTGRDEKGSCPLGAFGYLEGLRREGWHNRCIRELHCE